ncbi:trna pseudouridine synthase a [Ligilactobacillus hayakitensis DSM 18933 = JCM 14209]|uniref:tRNA pseudouridine synthase A n=1 Tax=Ligilactobacillus hayakitensis DSM 18933 = JCM 14209 TaxID=1423755 RepID=A0A0R1WPD8_9LACO|nr:tRNA pseudouridine(38-40) synthase TruA [Ligilactobacillus hayakitensis]KRM19751.1 trna pseudouridine synthase a [Ligilactobacillus hayakitensis DSM 18933 = JCM 14209]
MSQRFKITLAYDGTNFAGFQAQPNQRTVQSVLEKAVNKMSKLDDYITVHGSGRTDSGVHALGQVVHFDFPHEMSANGMLRGLNSMLPLDCEVKACEIVDKDFHSRFTTHGKRYMYRVARGEFVNPFKRNYTGHYKFKLDVERIKQAMPDVEGTHDYSSFVASGSHVKSHVRTIYEATVREDKENDEIIFEFFGNGFLYNQVRIMVAVLLEIGNGRRDIHDFLRLYEVKDRNEARQTAPASGLYLKEVYYD